MQFVRMLKIRVILDKRNKRNIIIFISIKVRESLKNFVPFADVALAKAKKGMSVNMEFFDSHAHLDDEKFDIDREEVITKIYNSGITKFVSCGYSLEGSTKAVELSEKYDFIYSTVGISPNDLSTNWEDDVEKVSKFLENKSNKIVAVGEIGLDYHYDTDKNWQQEAFIKQIEIANKYNLPIVIHTRDAVMDTLDILKQYPVNKKGIFHCCPFNRELIKEGIKLGFYISIAGPITFKNSKNAEEIAKLIPLDKMLIETDSPYLAPEPVRGTRNDPRNVRYIAKKIADFRNEDVEIIAKATFQNAKEIFGIS